MRKAFLVSFILMIFSATACLAQTPGDHRFFDRTDTDKSVSLCWPFELRVWSSLAGKCATTENFSEFF